MFDFTEAIAMSYLSNTSRHFVIVMMLAILSAIILMGFAQGASAAERGFRHKEYRDSRYNHNHYYPARGQYIESLPSGHRAVVHGNARYYFHGGAWYRPAGPRFVIVAPPFGMVVPFLPPYYATIWLGGIPYYYANNVYYTQYGQRGYVVVEPPKGEVSQSPPTADQLFIYPRKGQSEQQQSSDRYDCHRWAAGQADFDPTQPADGMPEAQMNQKRTDYQRAMGACLDARDYTVK
jgi:hypothetical protein